MHLSPLVEIRENPEFHDLMRMDKGHRLACLLWHEWLPLLSGTNGASPWSETAAQGAGNLLECAPGPCSSRLPFEWDVPPLPREGEGCFDVPGAPTAWTDGCLVQDPVSGASSSGSVFFFLLICLVFSGTIAGGVIWMRSPLMMGWFVFLLCPGAPAVCSEG